jgi:hypothetical protein
VFNRTSTHDIACIIHICMCYILAFACDTRNAEQSGIRLSGLTLMMTFPKQHHNRIPVSLLLEIMSMHACMTS